MIKMPEIKTNKIVIIFAIFSLIFSGFIHLQPARADSISDQRAQLEQKLKTINSQIQNYQGQINTTSKQRASLSNEISIYSNQIRSTELQIQAKETQIEDTGLQINELQDQINRRLTEIADNKKILGQLVVQLHELDADSLLNIGLGNNNFSDFLDQVQYTENVQGKVYQILQNIKTIKAKLETQQADLKVELKKLQGLKESLEVTKGSLDSQRKQKQSLLDKTKGIEKNYQKLLAASKSEEADLQKEIYDLDQQARAKLGQRTIIPSKGVLAWPMDGIMTQRYGNTGFTALGYNFHNGIDLAAPAGQPIYAAADGTVIAADIGEAAYGNWCAIKHTVNTKAGVRQIVSLYGHMRFACKYRAGQKVQQGDVIGYEGNTGNTTRLLYGPERGFHLHLTIFDADGFGVSPGKFINIYGSYSVPYGYTYNPLDFL